MDYRSLLFLFFSRRRTLKWVVDKLGDSHLPAECSMDALDEHKGEVCDVDFAWREFVHLNAPDPPTPIPSYPPPPLYKTHHVFGTPPRQHHIS